ncbi:MAG TPA: AMP-binding protein [Nitrolancea sp.]|nr:AMP-binding protein [Nitrolancea sp.]
MTDAEPTVDENSFMRRIAQLAEAHPDREAIVFAAISGEEQTISWAALERQTNQIARLLADRGVTGESMVVTGVWNSPEMIAFTIAAWKLGARVLPLRAILPPRERDEILQLAQPALVLTEWDDLDWPTIPSEALSAAAAYPDAPLPDKPHPGKAIGSGGSTGHPKLIVDQAWNPVTSVESGRRLGTRQGQIQLLAAPLYHNSPFLQSFTGLADDHTLVVMEKFDATRAADLIERRRVSYAYLPPILMRRLALLPDFWERDFSSFDAMHSSAAVCPIWLKQVWIDKLGPEKVYEVYGSAEGIGSTMIRGDEWLTHRGSVGRSATSEIRILDEAREPLPSGKVGEIFLRRRDRTTPTFHYIGAASLKFDEDGFASIGDLGWLDDDEYLYIADRRVDMIVSGGANVYPAEVEAALSEHSGLADVAVIGVPDEEWGRRVHAVVEPHDPANPPSVSELNEHVRVRIAAWKAPKTYEFVAQLPRNEAGKIRRTELAAERESGSYEGMIPVHA